MSGKNESLGRKDICQHLIASEGQVQARARSQGRLQEAERTQLHYTMRSETWDSEQRRPWSSLPT